MAGPTRYNFEKVATVDPEIMPFIQGEVRRQQNTLEMIASENHVSQVVLQALGSVSTNEFAEGYLGKHHGSTINSFDFRVQMVQIE